MKTRFRLAICNLQSAICNALHRSRFVVCQHTADEPCTVAQQTRDLLGANDAGWVHREPIDGKAVFREPADRLDHARMLNRATHEMARWIAGEAKDRQIVGLGRSTCEDHFVGVGAE